MNTPVTSRIPAILLLLSVIGIRSAGGAPVLAPAVTLTNFLAVLSHSGTPGSPHGIEGSINLQAWELIGPSLEVAPGSFQFTDPAAMHHPRRFYRAGTDYPPGTFAWRTTYPVSYLDGMEVDPLPRFAWTAFPVPGTFYSLEVYEALPDGSGGYAPVPPAVLHVAGLGTTSFTASGPLAGWPVDRDYLYRVSAGLAGGVEVRGRWVLIRGHGAANASFEPTGLRPAATGAEVRRMMRLAAELGGRKDALRMELESNKLVSEARLLQEVLFILQQPDGVVMIVNSILNAQLESLTDPENVLKGLCMLDKIVDFALDYDSKLEPPVRNVLKSFSGNLKVIKEALEMAEDRAAKLAEIKQQIEDLITTFRELQDNPLAYLKNLVTEKLKEKLRSMLANRISPAAAAAIFSIISDLVAFGDALLTLSELEDLCRELNRLLLAAIAAETSTATGWDYGAILPQSALNCNVTFAFKKMCWKPTPGGGPNDGEWETSPVPFAGGATSRTVPVSSLVTGPGPDGKIRISFHADVDPAALQCPPGAGPCILFFQVSYQCPGTSLTSGGNFYARAIHCP